MWPLPYRGRPGEGEGALARRSWWLVVGLQTTPPVCSPSSPRPPPGPPSPPSLGGWPIQPPPWWGGGSGWSGGMIAEPSEQRWGVVLGPIALVPRYSSMSPPWTPGHPRGTSQGRGMTMAWWPWAHRTSPASLGHRMTRSTCSWFQQLHFKSYLLMACFKHNMMVKL